MGLGWVIDGIEHYEYVAAGPENTNNVAEYLALTRLLDTMNSETDPGVLLITGDSMLVVSQVAGDWASSGRLADFCRNANCLIDSRKGTGWNVSLTWVDRAFNSAADHASKAPLSEQGIEPIRRAPEEGYTPRLGDIAKCFDISAVKLGKVLVEIGLRSADKEPTPQAIGDGCAEKRFDGHGLRVD